MQCQSYVANLRAEFTRKLVSLLSHSRREIDAQWTAMRAGAAQRATMFPPYFAPASEFSAELFEAHEAYELQVRALCWPAAAAAVAAAVATAAAAGGRTLTEPAPSLRGCRGGRWLQLRAPEDPRTRDAHCVRFWPPRLRHHPHPFARQVAKELAELKPLLEGVDKRSRLLADKLEYEAIIANPARLLAKSSSSE